MPVLVDAKTFLSGLASPLAEGFELAGQGVGSPAFESHPVSPSASGASEPASEQDSSLDWLPPSITPNGMEVQYRIKPRGYRVNGVEVPSVTTVLDCLNKPGLSWWGMQKGVEGVMELFYRGRLATGIDWRNDGQRLVLIETDGTENEATNGSVVSALTSEKLTVNHRLQEAGDRGTNVHSALEEWAKQEGNYFPTPAAFPDEERPYVEALLDWIQTVDGAAEIAGYEVMVGSAKHGFAGRYDLTIILNEPRTFVRKAYKRKQDMVVTVAPGRYTIDAKTSSGVYTSHFRQLAGYEIASVEGGYEPTDGQFVLHLMKDGRYEFVPSYATAEDFLSVLAVYQTEQRLKGK